MFSFRRGGRGVTNYQTITPVFASPTQSNTPCAKREASGSKTLASSGIECAPALCCSSVQQPTGFNAHWSGKFAACTHKRVPGPVRLSKFVLSDLQRALRDARDTRRRSSAGRTARRDLTTAVGRRPADCMHASRRNSINEPRTARLNRTVRYHLVPRMLASALLAGRKR